MKILHLLDEPWDSGVTSYALQIADLLRQKGHDVVIGVRPGKKPEGLAREMSLRTEPVENFFDARSLLFREAWDVVNAHSGRPHTWSVLSGLPLVGRRRRFALVRTRGDARAVPQHALAGFVYRHTDAVIAASNHVRDQYLSAFGLKEERVRTIYPSVDPDQEIQPSAEDSVGILGRLDVVKGHSVFLEAAAHILRGNPGAQFLIAGKEAGVSLQILENQARELGIERSIQFLGFVPSSKDFMRRCGVGVIASLGSEEVSRACLEWMSVGRPVVGTLVGCLSELIEPDETGYLVPAGDAQALADAVSLLLKQPSDRSRLGREAHLVSKKRFSPGIQVEETLKVYEAALRRARDAR